jgi:Tfp pilus assembly protein PilV
MSLVEVMVATILFAFMAIGLTATFTMNLRMAKSFGYRTQAVNTAMSIAEQIRATGYSDILDNYYTLVSPASFTTRLVDPTATAATPACYRDFTLPLNVIDTTTVVDSWTTTDVTVEPSATAPKLPMRFWLTLVRDDDTATTIHQVFRLALVYQWRSPASPNSEWLTEVVRIVVPNANAAVLGS